MKRCLLAILMFFSFANLFGQPVNDLFQQRDSLSKDYRTVASKYQALQLNPQKFTSLREQPAGTLQLELPFENKQLKLQLKKVTITSDNFSVIEALPGGGRRTIDYSGAVFYQGKIEGISSSFATISIVNDQVTGIIADNKSNIILGPIENKGRATNEYVLYRESDMKINNPLKCFTDDIPAGGPVNNNNNPPSANVNAVGEPVDIYFECDYQLYQDKGSNTVNVINYVLGFFNNTSLLYANENIKMQVSQILVWTTQDPEAAAGLNTTALALPSFSNRMLTTSFSGDYAHFLSTRSLGGGIAWLQSNPCGATKYYKSAVSAIETTYTDFPTYSWTVSVVTHELGHNLGSNHTHWCGWPGGAIDNCGPSAGYPTEGGCAAGPAPVNGGTIMSYCHLTGYGINFSNGFGPLPGQAIRNVVTGAACFGNCRMTIDITKQDASCGQNNGSATVIVTNGTGALTYTWSNGQTAATLFNAAPGTYHVKVNDASGCQVMGVVTIAAGVVPTLNTVPAQVVCTNTATTPINLTGPAAGTIFNWTNNKTSIGLAASGTGNIASFIATNTTNVPVTATINVTPFITNGFAYIPNFGSNNVSVISTASNLVLTTIPAGTNPRGVSVSPDGSRVYVSNGGSGNVSVISTATNSVVATIPVGSGPYGIVVSPDGSRVYTANNSSNNVSVISTATNSVVATIPAGSGPYGIAVSPDGSRVYVANGSAPNISVINTATNSVVATITVGTNPSGIAVSPDGSRVYVNNNGSANMSVINTATNSVVTTVSVGLNPRGISVSPDGSRVYIANGASANVSVINTATNSLVTAIPVAAGPFGVSVSPNGSRVYVTSLGSDVSVINTATNLVETTFLAGTIPFSLGNFITTIGCSGTSKSFTITVNPLSTINAISNQVLCNNTATAPVNFTGSVAGTTFNWTNNNTSIGLAATGTGNISSFIATNPTNAPVTSTITVTAGNSGYLTGFESGSFNPEWQTIGTVSITNVFGDVSPTEGSRQAHIANHVGVSTTALEGFLSLLPGSIDAFLGHPNTEGSAIKRTVTVNAGDVLRIDWNFVTSEFVPSQYDAALLSISGNGLNFLASTYSSVFAAIGSNPGGYTNQTGYQTFSYAFTVGGTYDIGLMPLNGYDQFSNSGLLVDNFRINGGAGFDCNGPAGNFTITVNPTATVTAPTITQPTCAVPTGTIVINATGGGTLEYSVNNGSTWQSSATFPGLVPGNYNIKVRLQGSGCVTNYSANPVVLAPPICNGKTIAGKIEAENWDTKSGGMYAIPTSDVGGGQHVVGISNGSSMNYNVTVTQTGTYTVNFRIATPQTGAQFQVKLGATVLGTVNIPNTGGWDNWQTVTVNNIALTAGVQTIQVLSINTATCNFNWMDWVLAGGNQPPTANAGSPQTIILPTNQVTLSGSGAVGSGGTSISYAWTQVSGTAATISSPSTAVTNITGLTTTGARVFRLTVTQNDGQTATSDVTVTVNSNVIQPPTANAGSPQTITLPTNQVTLSGSGAVGSGGTSISYAWTQVSGTAATISGPSTAVTNITGLTTAGARVFRLTVTQNDGQTATSDVTVTVNPVSNGKTIAGKIEAENWDTKSGGMYAIPTSDAGGGQHVVGISNGSSMNYNVTVTQTGTYTVNFRIATPQTGAQFQVKLGATVLGTVNIPNTGGWDNWQTVIVNNIALTAGVQTIQVLSINTATCNFNWMDWVLAGGNQPPTANAGSPQTIILPTNQVTLSGSGAVGSGGTSISYAWTQVSGTAATISSPSTAVTNITGLTTTGARVFRLTVIQNDGQTATSDVTVTVNSNVIQPPTANAGSPQTITLPTNQVTLSGSGAVGSGGTSISYAWTQVSGTAATISGPSTAVTNITGLTTAGARVFRLTVTQNDGQTATSDVTVTVNPVSNGKTIAGKIEAENWDTKSGGMYAIPTSDAGGGQHVVGISNGSSMNYNVTVTQTGTYTVNFRIATPQTGAQFQVKLGATVLGTVNIPNTGGWDNWQTVTVNNIALTAGVQTIQVLSINTATCNFNWMDWVLAATMTSINRLPAIIASTQGEIKTNNLFVSIFPNPTESSFNLKVQSKSMDLVTIKVFDMAGRQLLLQQSNAEHTVRFGDNIVNGTYLVEVRQGSERAVIKIVKQ